MSQKYIVRVRISMTGLSNVKCFVIYKNNTFPVALQLNTGYGFLIFGFLGITHNDAPQSVGLLLTSDQLVAETSI
jgi:hypothetical protein